jgi:hypothetical protein
MHGDRDAMAYECAPPCAQWESTIEPSTATPSVAPRWRPALWIALAMPARVRGAEATAVIVVAGSAMAAAHCRAGQRSRPVLHRLLPCRVYSTTKARVQALVRSMAQGSVATASGSTA